jgi:uncharacterized RDD family membrane protein YckC
MRRWPKLVPRGTIQKLHWNSAAQNGPVIRICPKCGALLLDKSEKCSICEIPLEDRPTLRARVSVGAQDSASQPEWRREVSRRLREYRARRHPGDPDDLQSGLPFRQEVVLEPEDPPKRIRARPLQRAHQPEQVEICIQPELDFSPMSGDRAHPQSPLVPIARLAERRSAGAIDASFLGLTFAGFLGLFRSLGGQVSLAKVDAIVCLVVVGLFYGLYFSLFTTLAGATPGLQLRGLTIVRLDGSLPDTRQLMWRSFGYLLSGAAMMLGFFWAFWDEDHFTWHDRISQTYITAASPVAPGDPVELQPGESRPRRHILVHK